MKPKEILQSRTLEDLLDTHGRGLIVQYEVEVAKDLLLAHGFDPDLVHKRPPFLTGSRRYGTPRDNSDLDLVVFLPEVQAEELRIAREQVGGFFDGAYVDIQSYRFGALNLIVCTEEREYDYWKECTEECCRVVEERGSRLDRYETLEIFKKLTPDWRVEKEKARIKRMRENRERGWRPQNAYDPF